MSISAQTMVTTITKALDNQDKFNEKKYATKAEASKLFKFKGSVNSPKNLPITGNQEGDVYNVLTTYTTAFDINGVHIKAGDNVVYTDDGEGNTGFDVLGGTTDLSNYYTKDQVDIQIGNTDEAISDYQINAAVAAANPDIKINFYGDPAKAVTMINEDTEGAATGYTGLTTAALSTDKTKLTLTATTIAEGYPSEFALNTAGTVATGTGTTKKITLTYNDGSVEVENVGA